MTLILYQGKNDISVPNDALTYSADGKSAYVYLVKDGKAEMQPVTVGHIHKKLTRVLTGLKDGDQLIATGVTRLFPGVEVEIHS